VSHQTVQLTKVQNAVYLSYIERYLNVMAYSVYGYRRPIVCLKYRPVPNAKIMYNPTVEIHRDVRYYS